MAYMQWSIVYNKHDFALLLLHVSIKGVDKSTNLNQYLSPVTDTSHRLFTDSSSSTSSSPLFPSSSALALVEVMCSEAIMRDNDAIAD
jgi:hypothetical protein